jgi:PTH1 family peptidyl-tRNA hydrolase
LRQGFGWLRPVIRRALGRARGRATVDRLIVGLGNPGARYAGTRHNVGFDIVDAFATRHALALDETLHSGRFGAGVVAGHRSGVLQPQTFMNASGESLAAWLADLPGLDIARHLIVVHDDLDLPLGRIRLRRGGGAGGHRGVSSIVAALERTDVPRLRFGIGRPRQGVGVVEYVLEPFADGERPLLRERIAVAVDALDCFVQHGIETAMDRFNAGSSQGDSD